jgi:hypothetical protein
LEVIPALSDLEKLASQHPIETLKEDKEVQKEKYIYPQQK